MPLGRGYPLCPCKEDAGDRAPFVLAAEWQAPAKAEKGKLLKSNVQEDDIGLGSVRERGSCQLGLGSSWAGGLRIEMEGEHGASVPLVLHGLVQPSP